MENTEILFVEKL